MSIFSFLSLSLSFSFSLPHRFMNVEQEPNIPFDNIEERLHVSACPHINPLFVFVLLSFFFLLCVFGCSRKYNCSQQIRLILDNACSTL